MSWVIEVLSQPNKKWTRFSSATERQIAKLISACKIDLPEELLDLLRFSNGGEGEIALPPRIFRLNTVDEIIDLVDDEFYREEFADFLFFGGNGGIEMFALNLRKPIPFSVVAIDPIGGSESAIEIAANMTEFIKAIGFEYEEYA
jgi:hypothetical protein